MFVYEFAFLRSSSSFPLLEGAIAQIHGKWAVLRIHQGLSEVILEDRKQQSISFERSLMPRCLVKHHPEIEFSPFPTHLIFCSEKQLGVGSQSDYSSEF